ncbi:MAG TPA: FAD:protein FMN transferase, partial [Armatimonadota bacterium]|nr:FAD:protein FMN transferase [Armatimonadota bacterium]
PRTGFPARGVRSATVLAESATDTDALSTAAFVLGEAGARRICAESPGLGAVLVPEPRALQSDDKPEVVVLGNAMLLPEERATVD